MFLYHGTLNLWFSVLPSLISMLFSLLSLLKTSYDLQEVDRTENAVSCPRSLLTYFVTSVVWFSSTVVFRLGCVVNFPWNG